MSKLAYISPNNGELTIAIRRDQHPEVYVTIDLGIPNWSIFSIRFPFAQENPEDMGELVWGALRVLLDDLSLFMLSQGYQTETCTDIYARILATFKAMNVNNSDTDGGDTDNDAAIKAYEGQFQLPGDFVNETQRKIVVGSGNMKIIKRQPPVRQLELTYMKPNKPTPNDAARVIRQFRNKIIRNQPSPLYVLVYNMKGVPVGITQLQKNVPTPQSLKYK